MIACIQKGDKKAFGKLYDRYAPALLSIIRGMVADTATAEEILQAAFLKILQDIGTFEPSNQRFFTRIVQVARHLALESGENQKNMPGREIRAAENFVNSPTDHPYNGLKNGQFQSDPGTERTQALQLIFIKGLSNADAAGVLNTTQAGLKQQIRNELKMLSGVGVPIQ